MPTLDTRPFTATLEPSDIIWVDKGDGLGGYTESARMLGSALIAQMTALSGGNYYNSDLSATGDRLHDQNDRNLTVVKAKTMRYSASVAPDDSEAHYIWRGIGDAPIFDFQNSGSQSVFRGNSQKQTAINSDSWIVGADLELNSNSDSALNKVFNIRDLAKTTDLMTVWGDGDIDFGGTTGKDITIGEPSAGPVYHNIFMKNGTHTHYWGSYNNQMYFNSAYYLNFLSNASNIMQVSGEGVFIYDGKNLTLPNSKIATSPTQKIAFYGSTPVVRQVLSTGAGATADDIITFLQTIGLCQQV